MGRNTTFDGGGYTISNLYINRPAEDGVGLLSTNDGIARNFTLTNVNISGNNRVGGLAGKLQSGSILSVSVSGTVTGTIHVGGLVGYSYGQPISASYTDVDVTGKNSVGGLVGHNSVALRDDEIISGSSAIGAVIGEDKVGGLVGENSGVIRNSTAEIAPLKET